MSNLISNQGSVKHLQICTHNEIPLFTHQNGSSKKKKMTIPGVHKKAEERSSHTLLVGTKVSTSTLGKWQVQLKLNMCNLLLRCIPTYSQKCTLTCIKTRTRTFTPALSVIGQNWKQPNVCLSVVGRLN